MIGFISKSIIWVWMLKRFKKFWNISLWTWDAIGSDLIQMVLNYIDYYVANENSLIHTYLANTR